MLKDFQKVLTIFLLLLKPEIKKDQEKLNEIIVTWFKLPRAKGRLSSIFLMTNCTPLTHDF